MPLYNRVDCASHLLCSDWLRQAEEEALVKSGRALV
jgi:hypothetical protein